MTFFLDIFKENSEVSSKRILSFLFFFSFCMFGCLDKIEIALMAASSSCACIGVTAYQKIKEKKND